MFSAVFATAIAFVMLLSPASAGQFFSTIDNTVILPPFTKVAELTKTVIYDGNTRLSGDALIKTGFTAYSDGEYKKIAVIGDVNADGFVNSTDFMQLRRHYLQQFLLNGLRLTAADTNLDDKINSTDFTRIRRQFLEIFNFSSSKPFSSSLTDSGAIIPTDILAPSSEEICFTYLNYGKYLNYYFAADFSRSAYGYFDLSYVFRQEADRVTLTVTKDDNENKFIINGDRLDEPFRFNFCYGDGDYQIHASIKCDGKTFTALSFTVSVGLVNEYAPFIISAYPTVYDNGTDFVKKATELCTGLDSDFEKIAVCYRYIADTQDYHYTVSTDEYRYLPDLDDIYSRGYGVCWDFCAALAAMLRSQGIPCRIDIGYAYGITDTGHAWLTVYTDEKGSYEDEYLKINGEGETLLDITASVCKNDKSAAKEYIESMVGTYSAFKYF